MYNGWLQDSIWDLIQSNWEVFDKLPYALVTCIDSSEDMKSTITARKIVELEGSCSFLGRSLLVSDGRIVDVAQRYNLFSHFDEIWLYRDRPAVDKPTVFSIVSPLELSTDSLSRELLEWFDASGCILGLGDGIGMNYVTTSKEIVQSLNIRQREFDS
ncbi:MAG: hypothetical protein ACYS30_25710 [Planctomycetota bacterium]|jgi:hypothetical protein